MSELDFDELDKAVNTLMGDVPKVEPPKTDDVKTLSINSTLSDTTPPSFDQLGASLSAVNGSAARPAGQKPALTTPPPSLATRRSGRFMDVVHPSSNMKTAPRPFGANTRQGVAIQPDEKLLTAMSADQSDVVKALDVVQPAVTSNNARTETTPEPVTAPADNGSNDWPDPLDMSGYEVEPASQVAEAPKKPETSPVVASPAEVDDDDDDIFSIDELNEHDPQPLNSPFIADAKVEKRPLGGVPAEEVVEEPGRAPVLGALVTDEMAKTDPADQLPASPVATDVQLPPEFQSDLMAIETDGGTVAQPAEKAVVSQTDSRQQEVPSSSVVTPVVSEVKPVIATSVVGTGPTSIPQQYQEEKSTSDQSNGSIYDTDSYHQPLAHPAKAKSGWLLVVWILLLLIVGGGGAVALYFMGII